MTFREEGRERSLTFRGASVVSDRSHVTREHTHRSVRQSEGTLGKVLKLLLRLGHGLPLRREGYDVISLAGHMTACPDGGGGGGGRGKGRGRGRGRGEEEEPL